MKGIVSKRVEEVFNEAMDKAPNQRAAFVTGQLSAMREHHESGMLR